MDLSYTEKARAALEYAFAVSKKLKHYYVGCEHILFGLIHEGTGTAAAVLANNNITENEVILLIRDLSSPGGGTTLRDPSGFTPKTEHVLEMAAEFANRYHSSAIGTEHLLLAIIDEGTNCAIQIMLSLKKNPKALYVETLISMGLTEAEIKENEKRSKKNNVSFLKQYSKDLTLLAKEDKLDPIVGRDREIGRVIQILSRRTKNNPCLVGEPGVGKTAIAEGLALRIVSGDVPDTLRGKRLLTLDLPGMVAGTKYRGEFEERIKRMLSEVTESGDIILFLDEIHTLVGAGGSEGGIDAASMLKPALSRGEIQLIGATTLDEYRKYVEKDAALERRFQPVDVAEPTVEEAIRILGGIKGAYEAHHGVKYTDEAIETAVLLAHRYINDRFLPDKAIDLMDEAGAAVRLNRPNAGISDKLDELNAEIRKLDDSIAQSIKLEAFARAAELRNEQSKLIRKADNLKKKNASGQNNVIREVTSDHIARVVATWTGVPVTKLNEKESDRLLKLEDILHKRVIGQEEAVSSVARAMRRQRVGLQDPQRPLGSFLFLGPTGVGKTELSKALAEAMFGSEDNIIRVDMSEYMEGHSVAKLIGAPPGYVGHDDGGQLSEKVRKNPYSVVLFDEVEKAHPDVFNVLLQVLDDGHITDSKGRKVSFKNTIIIMTSNAGARQIVEPKNLGFATKSDEERDYKNMKSSVMDEVKRLFKPEFINRIDEIIVFHQLTKANMIDICSLVTDALSKRCLDQMNIKLSVSKAMKSYILDKYMDQKMGARPIKRAVLNVIEDPLSEEILKKSIVSGDSVRVDVNPDEKATVKAKFVVKAANGSKLSSPKTTGRVKK